MAGKTIEEAHATQEAACIVQCNGTNRPCPNQSTTNTANTAMAQATPFNDNLQTFTFNGKSYMMINDTTPTTTETDSANISMPSYDEDEYYTFIGATEEAHVSIN